MHRILWIGLAGLAVGVIAVDAAAQVRPDGTLGSEASRVRADRIRGRDGRIRDSDVIEGGAQRGSNLFHSFEQFDVPEGRGAYFSDPAEVQNIFSRVTGADRSEILGTLGVLGDANLYFMNPNGILFGPNASLDIQGSFVGTTANDVQFGDQGFFGVTDQSPPSLLTVNPSAFLFNQISTNAPEVRNSAILAVPEGRSLLLLGGEVQFDQGIAFAPGGRVELGGLAEPGIVGIETAGDNLSLNFPANVARGNVSLRNSSIVSAVGTGNGDTSVYAQDVSLTQGSRILAGLNGSSTGEKAGDIRIDATGIVALSDFSFISNRAFNGAGNSGDIIIFGESINIIDGSIVAIASVRQGEAGNVFIQASDTVSIRGRGAGGNSGIFSSVTVPQEAAGVGSGGNIQLRAPNVFLDDKAYIETTTQSPQGSTGNILFNGVGRLVVQGGSQIQALTFGSGRAGDITVNADSIELAGTSADRSLISAIGSLSGVNPATGVVASGDAGNVTVNTRTLQLQDGASISTNTFGQGRGGELQVRATESIDLTGTATLANGQVFRSRFSSATFGSGRAGNLTLETGRLSVQAGAGILASTVGGSGRAGDIAIDADSVEITGASADRSVVSVVSSRSEVNPATGVVASGDAGNVTVNTRTLRLQDGAAITTNAAGQGSGGNLQVRATEFIELLGTATLADGRVFNSQLLTGTSSSGRAGNLRIITGDLQIRGGAGIIASTNGAGRAGNLRVEADSIRLSGTSRNQPRRQQFSSGIASETISRTEDAGNAGNIRISTRRLNIRDRAAISTTTFGQGNAGNIRVQNQGATILNDGDIRSSVAVGATGNGGQINLRTRSLSVDGGRISAVVSRQGEDQQGNPLPGGRGRGGDIFITAADEITLTGTTRDGFSGGVLTLSERGANGSAGDITIRAGDLQIANGAIVVASTFNQGDGGNIEINADNFEVINGGQVVTNTRNAGQAGTITLNIEENVTLSGFDPNFQDRQEQARRYTQRPNVTDRVNDVIISQGSSSGLFANTSSQSSGDGGTITLNTENLLLTDSAAISARSQGEGTAGNIRITASERLQSEAGNVTTRANRSVGGDIQITGGDIDLNEGSNIRTDVEQGAGNGGDINVTADAVRLQDDSDIQTRVGEEGNGDGGNISVTADSVIAFDDSDIITEAPNRGGDITLNTPVFFGAGYQPDASTASDADGNGRVDLDASGEVSAGAVQTPDVSFIQNSLSDLPDGAINTEELLANSCISRDQQTGTFLITGSGSLPSAPGNNSTSTYPTGEVRPIPESERDRWQPGDPVVEPQGVYRLPDGRLVMSRECPETFRNSIR